MHRQIYFLLFFLLMQPSIFFGSDPEITSIFHLGGQVIGASDKRGAQVEDRIVTIGDLFATIYKALVIDWTKEYMSPIERPIKIANSIGGEVDTPSKNYFNYTN